MFWVTRPQLTQPFCVKNFQRFHTISSLLLSAQTLALYNTFISSFLPPTGTLPSHKHVLFARSHSHIDHSLIGSRLIGDETGVQYYTYMPSKNIQHIIKGDCILVTFLFRAFSRHFGPKQRTISTL